MFVVAATAADTAAVFAVEARMTPALSTAMLAGWGIVALVADAVCRTRCTVALTATQVLLRIARRLLLPLQVCGRLVVARTSWRAEARCVQRLCAQQKYLWVHHRC